MAKTLFAVDELSGFVAACAYVRPTGIDGHDAEVGEEEAEAAVVRRRRSTATRCAQGAEELGVDFDEHVAFVIAALAERADELGLGPREAASTTEAPPPEGGEALKSHQCGVTAVYGSVDAVVANTSVRLARLPLLARTWNGLKPGLSPPPAKSRPA